VTTVLRILQHALGRDEFGQRKKHLTEDYRNHYVAGGDAVALCRHAVADGLMIEHSSTVISGGDPWFHVTEKGQAHIAEHSKRPPMLTRGQKRYRRFLDVSDMSGMTFRDFLTWERTNPV
jgi:hypothetical protein